jgi:ParB/RepB/Spo0J family partition protein
MSKLVECEYCHTYTSDPQNWENHVLCERCLKEATANPERFKNYFAYLNRGKKSKNTAQETASPYTLLPVEALLTMPFVRRKDVEGKDFEDLVESIKAVGVLEPIIVRPKPNGLFEVVVGDRRHAAAKKAKLVEIPAIVKPLSDEDAYGIRIVENVQRKDLSGLEKADWLSFMIKTFGYTQEVLAKKLGKTQGWVSQNLAILQIPESITRVIKHGELTEYQAREILSAPEDKREAIVNEINKTGEVPSAREIHELAHPEEKPKTVPCARCGDPVSNPVHADSKFYCQECYELVEAAKPPSLVSEGVPHEDIANEPIEPSEPSEKPIPQKPEELDTGLEITCPECEGKLYLIHVNLSNGKVLHKLEGYDF